MEQRAAEAAEITSRAVLDRDSLEADVTSLREQIQSLETAMIAEKSTTTGLEVDLRTTSERREELEAAVNAKDQEMQQLVHEIDGLRRQIEEYVDLKGRLQGEISRLESTVHETRTELSATQESASQLTASLVTSQVARAGLLEHITSLESSLAQHREESAQELSNLQETHAHSLAEERSRVSELGSSLTAAGAGLSELRERLNNTILSMEDERNTLLSDISSLKQSLETSDRDVRCLEGSYEISRVALQDVTKELGEMRGELEALQIRFAAEVQQSVTLASALEETNGRIRRMEKETATVEVLKKADEKTIRQISTSYGKLRKFHADCLAEMDEIVGIIQERERD